MNIEIKEIVYKDLSEVAYGMGSLLTTNRNKVTIHFVIETDILKLDGYLELPEKEYIENVPNLKQVILNKLIN